LRAACQSDVTVFGDSQRKSAAPAKTAAVSIPAPAYEKLDGMANYKQNREAVAQGAGANPRRAFTGHRRMSHARVAR